MSTTSHETEHHVEPSEGDRPVESMPSLTFGLIAAPGLPAEIAAGLERELPQLLAARYPGISWVVTATEDTLVSAGSSGVEVIDATRRRLLERDWDLAVCLTDRPLLTGRRPVLADASAAHNAGAISLPALGAVNLRRRTRDLIIDMVDTLLGEPGCGPASTTGRRRVMGRLAELATPVRASAGSDGDLTVRFVAAVVRGNLRLLVGMVHANRPWRLAARLSRALAAALATVVFALVFSDIWRLADGASWPRLLAISISSISATTIWLVAVHGLWERRGQGAHADEQVVLFDLVTVITVVIGMLTLYVMLFLLTLAAAALLLPPVNLEHALHHPIDGGAYARLAWLASSLATVVGALGSGLESDTAVREAAYGYIPEQADDQ